MINKPTVLILGAGASNHLGYPIGIQLVNMICQKEKIEKFKKLNEKQIPEDHIDDFIKILSRAQYYSIDGFLEENSKFIEIGKLFITYILKQIEIESQLFPPNNPGWYQYLFNSIIDKTLDDIVNNQIYIITYNYDRSLECYLHQSIKYRFHQTDEKALSILNQLTIIHMHGILGAYPFFPYEPNDDITKLKEISNGIKIIHELDDNSDSFCSEEYSKANSILHKVENIYFLGFGFHDSNLRRFNFFNSYNIENKNIMTTLHGLGPIDKQRLLKKLDVYGLSNIKHNPNPCNGFFNHMISLE